MKKIEFTDQDMINAACLEIPILGEIREGRHVSVIYFKPAEEIVNLGFSCAMGFNHTGWMYGNKYPRA